MDYVYIKEQPKDCSKLIGTQEGCVFSGDYGTISSVASFANEKGGFSRRISCIHFSNSVCPPALQSDDSQCL